MKRVLFLLSITLLISCNDSKSNIDFITAVSGYYWFNSDESIKITFEENEMRVKWRGKENIKPLKVNDSTFYIQEMNEKFIFVLQPKVHIKLAAKREHKGKAYVFNKMLASQKTPTAYFLNKEYKKALEGYLAIQEKDSLDKAIDYRTLSSYGYQLITEKKYEEAIELLKINTQLHAKNTSTYNSLANAYLRNKDTVNAIKTYTKALSIHPENTTSKRALKRITKK
ncbi:MAG: hypothetical protein P8H13_06075 [Polaribacter sp.]|nr:hypothetical protein [Polaribacter sp.]MDG1811485.1 hypothetical protein [Polaribacter sp.]MDG1994061.1 hypothetical protein [Polaribacter sp.]